MAIYTTTTRAVRFHGWTLPKGASVKVTGLRNFFHVNGVQELSASCETSHSDYGVGVPFSALNDREVILATMDVEVVR
jgi:hypothetical protein